MINKAHQLLLQDIDPYVSSFLPETIRFLYSGLYVKRKQRMKHSLRISAFEKNLVQNDYLITLSNGFKTFSEVNSGLFKYRYKQLNNPSLTAVARLKKDIFFRTNEMIYLTHRFMDFRNLIFKMSNNQYHFINFNTYARPLNKRLFFSLMSNLHVFSFKLPSLIMYHYRKFLRLRVYYLGFRLIIRKKRINSLLNGTALNRSRYKRKVSVKKYYKLKKLIRYKRKRPKVRLTRIKRPKLKLRKRPKSRKSRKHYNRFKHLLKSLNIVNYITNTK